MSRITALRCDIDRCDITAPEESASKAGWLTIGGQRKGRPRYDLCPFHARQTIGRAVASLNMAAAAESIGKKLKTKTKINGKTATTKGAKR